jgi:ribosomal protein S18 acetylase RimI-like enzyme
VDRDALRQSFAGLALEDRVTDVRYLAVWDERVIASSAALKVDGATAVLHIVDGAVPAGHAGRGGNGDALVRGALAMAADARCDLVVLDAEAAGGSSAWYGRHGFTEIGRSWSATAQVGA